MCIALRMRVFARMFKKQNLMDVLTLCAKLGYDLKDAELVDDMLLKVQGVRL